VALRWYYSEVTIVGGDRVPERGPMLVAVNHPNALVDVLVAGKAVPRQLMFTAKATLFGNPIGAVLLRSLGVLPLRRASDEAAPVNALDRTRNADSFAAVADALSRAKAILIFPEGKSHDEPALAPARTGAARMVMQARESRQVAGIQILPIGLIFERKDKPRSRIVAIVGEPIDVDPLIAGSSNPVRELTATIDARLRELTLNYPTAEDAERDARLARVLQSLLRSDAPAISDCGDFRSRAEIARVLPAVRRSAEGDGRLQALEADLLAFDAELAHRRISLDDVAISRHLRSGSVFVIRELSVLLLAGPIAAWGWLNHLLPFRAAFLAGGRVRHSAADPAMRVIVAGAAFVLMMYMIQGATVTLVAGPWVGLAYVASLPIAADINLRMRDRLGRALRRAHAFIRFRSQPAVQDEMVRRANALRARVVELAREAGFTDLD
jgi:glycerol-3-phosphate O-acyltransferase/dihydroxyacetone phosphate acyltransferase